METPSEVDLLLSVSRPSPPRDDHGPPKRRRSQRRPKTKHVGDACDAPQKAPRQPRRRGGTRARAAPAPPAGVGGIAWAPPAPPAIIPPTPTTPAPPPPARPPEAVDQDALAAEAMRLRPASTKTPSPRRRPRNAGLDREIQQMADVADQLVTTLEKTVEELRRRAGVPPYDPANAYTLDALVAAPAPDFDAQLAAALASVPPPPGPPTPLRGVQ